MALRSVSGIQSSSTSSDVAEDFFSSADYRSEFYNLASIFDQWNELRGNCFAPNYADFELNDLDNEILPYCAVVDVLPDGLNFKYRFWGTALVEITNLEMTGKYAQDLKPKSLAEAGVKAYADVLELRTATVTTILMQQVYGVTAKTISLRLPMSSNQTDIDFIFSKSSLYFNGDLYSL